MGSPIGGGAGLILGSAASAASASAQNSAIRAQQQAVNRAVGVQQQQAVDAAEHERRLRLNEAHMIQGKLRVAAGEAGTGFGGTYQALQRQGDYDAAMNDAIARRNLKATLAAIRTGGQAQSLALASQHTNPLLETVVGGIGGLNAGLQIAGGIDRVFDRGAALRDRDAAAGRAGLVQKDFASL